MPTYNYECDFCGERRVDARAIALRHDGPNCPRCRKKMALAPAAPVIRFKGDFSGGTSSRYKVHEEQATVTEMHKHAASRKRERERKADEAREKHVGEMLSSYAI